ncbi:hypothetical protein C5167_034559 [Papaver somniferum]|uniref:Uncharacterized protein n=1 Tax=Papaver somniferum TaxID=3469 RepID=A0A4Y7KDC3_PAPSO|nr:hypothetical protein C5167_034559 [Papaver somniferum]
MSDLKVTESGGFGMSEVIAKQSTEENSAQNIKNPSLGWMIGFLFVVSFLGLFSVVPLRKIMVIDFKLIYPSGTATAHHINSFHTPQGAKLANEALGKFFSFSFLWGFFQWFFTSVDGCGFINFPTFGLKALENRFYFDFSATYVGGDWYPAELSPNSLHGIQGYRIFIAIAMILGDGLYNFVKVLNRTVLGLLHQLRSRDVLPVADQPDTANKSISYDDQLLAFCNAYGCGLTDWSLASTYGKLAIFTIGAWAGASHGGVLAGLAACGVMMNIVSTASDLMQDFKTGYMTLASPRSMFVSQVIGTAMGCIISPCVFWLFVKAFDDLGIPGSEYPAPYALVYRNMAILGVEGFSSLPKNCLKLCYGFFAAVIFINAIRDSVGKKWSSYFVIDMCLGSLILFVWEKVNKPKADAFGPCLWFDMRRWDMDFAKFDSCFSRC